VVHAAGRPPATGTAAAEPGTATQRRGRRHEEIAFGGRPRRRRLAERYVAQAWGRWRVGGRRRREEPFVGRWRREQAARPAFLDRGNGQRTITVTTTADATTATITAKRRRGRGRGARHTALGHRGHCGRAYRHRQHGPAGPGGAALVLH